MHEGANGRETHLNAWGGGGGGNSEGALAKASSNSNGKNGDWRRGRKEVAHGEPR